jgi:HPr kinase/phosphorylase
MSGRGKSGMPPIPPSSGTGHPNSVRHGGPPSQPPAGLADWPDDETYGGGGTHPTGRPHPTMTPRGLLEEKALAVPLTLLAGHEGVHRVIDHTRIQKSGLALASHYHGIVPTRIQILGQTEQSYVNELDGPGRARALGGFFGLGLSCVILTGELGPSTGEIMAHAERSETPLLHSADRSSVTITALHALLDERLAPRQRLHGVLIDVFGVGLLLMGSSGVGKSECALDLVMRGHRLVADDVVECDYRPPGMVFGAPAHLLRHHLEVRGLGILNIKDLFGVTAIRERKRIDVVVRLAEEGAQRLPRDVEVDRLGIDERFHTILGVSIPELVIPVRPGRDMASILEVAARNELLKNAGHHAGRELFGAIESAIRASDLGRGEGTPETPAAAMMATPEPPPSSEAGHALGGVIDRSGRGYQRPAAPRHEPVVAARTPSTGRPPFVSEHEISRSGAWRNDESAMPPPVGGGAAGLGPHGGRGKGR